MKDFDVIAVGNAHIDVFLSIHEAETHCRVNEKECEICFPYGQKVPVDSSEFSLGGGASNVAVGLSRLGFHSGLIAEIGSDEFEQKIINTLSKEGVDQTHIIETLGAGSSFSIGITFKGERTLFVKHVHRSHNFQFDNITTKWVYLGGLGKEWIQAYKKTLDFVQTSNLRLSFAPGTTQIKEGTEDILPIIQRSDILFLNKDEAENITGIKGGEKDLLVELQKMGAKTVIVTDGKNGSYVADAEGNMYSMGIHQAPIVEKTGAGDAYASGFLGALLLNLSIEEATKWGTYNAASVIGKVGAQTGLLTQEQIKKQPDLEVQNLLQ